MSGAQGGSEGCPLPAHAPCSYKYDNKGHLASSFLSVRGRLGAESRGVNRQTAKKVTQVAASGVFCCARRAFGERLSAGGAPERRNCAAACSRQAAAGSEARADRAGCGDIPCGASQVHAGPPGVGQISVRGAKKLWKTCAIACGHLWLCASCAVQASARAVSLTSARTRRFVARGSPVLKITLSPPTSLA